MGGPVITALLFPTVLLVAVLCIGAALLWGMGRRPMLGLSRATYPTARGRAPDARREQSSGSGQQKQGAAVRVVKHGDDPRGAALAQPWPFPSLRDKRASGAPACRCAHGGDGYSGEAPSALYELPTPQPRIAPTPVFGNEEDGRASAVCASCTGHGLCSVAACPATCAHGTRRANAVGASCTGRGLCSATVCPATCAREVRQWAQCGEVPHRASGRAHACHVCGVLVHTVATGAASASSPFPPITPGGVL